MKQVFLLLAIITFPVLRAQVEEVKNWVWGIHGGFNQYNGELGNGWYAQDQAAYSFAGFSVTRFLNPHFDLTLLGTRGDLGYQSVWIQNEDRDFLVRESALQLFARYYPIGREYFVQPFLLAGGGLLWQKPRGDNYYPNQKPFDFAVPSVGAGVNLRLTKWMRLQFQEIFIHTSADYVDYRTGGYNDLYLMHCAGLIFNVPTFKFNSTPGKSEVEVDKCPPLLKEIQKKRKEKQRLKSRENFSRKKKRS